MGIAYSHVAVFRVAPEYLRQALSLPVGTEVVGARSVRIMGHMHIEVAIDHPDLPVVADGERPTEVNPTFHDGSNGKPEFIGWG